MSHTNKKNGVPDKASGTPLFSVCGILCGQRESVKSYSAQKLLKAKENTQNPKISGVILELLSGFEPETSSLPSRPKNFSGRFCSFRSFPLRFNCSLAFFGNGVSEFSKRVCGWLCGQSASLAGTACTTPNCHGNEHFEPL